jgi:hypothetical protein
MRQAMLYNGVKESCRICSARARGRCIFQEERSSLGIQESTRRIYKYCARRYLVGLLAKKKNCA